MEKLSQIVMERSTRIAEPDNHNLQINATNNPFSTVSRLCDLNRAFPTIYKKDFISILDNFQDNYVIDTYSLSYEQNQRLDEMKHTDLVKDSRRDPFGEKGIMVLNKDKFNLSEWEDIICSKLIQIGMNMTELQIKETSCSEYDRVPPNYILEKAEAVKWLFDELVVIYPEHTLVTPEEKVIDDPLLCGKIKGFDWRFLVAVWDEDIHVTEHLISYNQTTTKKLSNILK